MHDLQNVSLMTSLFMLFHTCVVRLLLERVPDSTALDNLSCY